MEKQRGIKITNVDKKEQCNLYGVVGSTVIETRTLKGYEFYCDKCNTIHTKTAYAIAQETMHVELIFTCKCCNKIDL